MNDKNKHIDPQTLISKYLANEASSEEIVLLEDWVVEDKANKKLFNDYKQAWGLSNIEKLSNEIDVDKEWKTLETKLFSGKTIQIDRKEKTGKTGFNQYLRIAASVIVLLSLGFVLYYLFSNSGREKYMAENSVITTTLADGSEITLNHNSTLTYFKKAKNKRKVKLEGDAFFKVEPDASKPFVIETQNVEIKVLGTSFYVNSHKDKPIIEVIVNTGKVAFKTDRNKQIVLTPGEKGIYNKETGKLQQEKNNDVNFIAWKTKHFEFDNGRLADVIIKISEVYHTNIRIANPEINNCRITVTFDNQSLDAVLNVLRETLDLSIKEQDAEIIVSGNGCE
ncbi:MAG: hypothetical protein B6D61_02270 [Bacteroidetes bacterium 4484_249]|nr:MAG: hypothetical protein B6D61_02270 [Bacteroidetes bacterium 4484_249]